MLAITSCQKILPEDGGLLDTLCMVNLNTETVFGSQLETVRPKHAHDSLQLIRAMLVPKAKGV
jgi:hypothetical protein